MREEEKREGVCVCEREKGKREKVMEWELGRGH